MLEEDPKFSEKFKRLFNNDDILGANDFTPKMLEDTYLDMDIALPIYGEGPMFTRVTNRLQDKNGIPICRHHKNPMLDTGVYEVEYLDGHKSSLAVNIISENLTSRVDKESNIFVIFDYIVDHCANVT